ncbi:MAG: glycosyltransferase family 4 protein [Terriglobia bacterium]|jgi:glycosyltransferase involved in cell wall biosynthesis|nr:glycosyltransferase family 4 protein [Terriglobia bacterium]
MRISVCHLASGDLWAGAEIQVSILLKALAQRPNLAVSAILLNEGRLAVELRQCGIGVEIIPESSNSFRNIVSRSAVYLSGRGVQILHSHRYKENLLAVALHFRCGIPYLVRTEHGWTEPTFGVRKLKHGAVRVLDRLAAKRYTDLIISPSEDLRKKIVGFAQSKKIVTVLNAIDTSRTTTELTVAAAKRQLGIAETVPVVGCAGRLERVKRLDRFLSAAVHIKDKVPEAQFVIAGNGSQRRELEELARSLGISRSVLFCGHRDDILDVLQAFDLFVMTSDHEGLPMALLQAMCLQKPVVCTAVGGIPEVVESGRNGILVDANDQERFVAACLSMLGDRELASALGRAARNEVVSRFDVSSHAESVARLYEGLCHGK